MVFLDLVTLSVLLFVKYNQMLYLFKSSGSYNNAILNLMF